VPDELITLWRYRDLPEALIAQSKLESAEVASFLADGNIIRLDWFYSNAWGGLRLQVADVDVQDAVALLSEEIPVSISAEEVGEEYRQPTCPRCASRDVSYETFYKGIALLFLWLWGLPIWIPRFKRWKCEGCGHSWRAEYE